MQSVSIRRNHVSEVKPVLKRHCENTVRGHNAYRDSCSGSNSIEFNSVRVSSARLSSVLGGLLFKSALKSVSNRRSRVSELKAVVKQKLKYDGNC